MGIEPTKDCWYSPSTALKAAEPTRCPDTPGVPNGGEYQYALLRATGCSRRRLRIDCTAVLVCLPEFEQFYGVTEENSVAAGW